MRTRILLVLGGVLLFMAGYFMGNSKPSVAYAQAAPHGGIPKAYGHLVAAVVNPEGTGLVFEDGDGVIRLVTLTGKIEAQFTRN
jgi:hypothetical protein